MGPQLTSIGPKTSPSFTRGLCQVLTDLLDVKIYNMCRPTQICLNFQFRPFFLFSKNTCPFYSVSQSKHMIKQRPPFQKWRKGDKVLLCTREKILCMAGNRNSSSSEKIRQKNYGFWGAWQKVTCWCSEVVLGFCEGWVCQEGLGYWVLPGDYSWPSPIMGRS